MRRQAASTIFCLLVTQMPSLVHGQELARLSVSSSSFSDGAHIPSLYTCDGDDVSPHLAWTGVPKTTKSIVVTMDDPDAPRGVWNHWYVYDIPPSVDHLSEGISGTGRLPSGSVESLNDFDKHTYGGPCPPRGTHRYVCRVRAVDIKLNDPNLSRNAAERLLSGHVIGEGHLIGHYSRR